MVLRHIPGVLFATMCFLAAPTLSYALELHLDFFIRPNEAPNLFFQTPQRHNGRFFFIQHGTLYIVEKSRLFNPIEIAIDETPISKIEKYKNFFFCSDKSRVVEVSGYGIERKEDIPFPCLSPPLVLNGRIYIIDLRGNVCFIDGSERKCIKLVEDKLGEVKLIRLSSAGILSYANHILVPYGSELFALSEDLRIRYKLLEFRGSEHINTLKLVESKLFVSTEREIAVFEIRLEDGVLKSRPLLTKKADGIFGADFDGEKIVFTYRGGFGVIKNGKTYLKPIKGIIDLSYPVLYGEHFFFVAQFGEKVGRIFGERKNSLIVVSVNGSGKPEIKSEHIIHSFARILNVSDESLFFLTEDSTLYVFKVRK